MYPAACPLSFMVSTNPSVVARNGWKLVDMSFLQSAGLYERRGGHAGSSRIVSVPDHFASTTNTDCDSIVSTQCGQCCDSPPLQTTGRQTRKSPQKFSPNGSAIEVSERPTISPRLLIDPATLKGTGSPPPSVPRSVITPRRQRKACSAASPSVVENPTTHPLSFTPKAWLKVPPSVPKL